MGISLMVSAQYIIQRSVLIQLIALLVLLYAHKTHIDRYETIISSNQMPLDYHHS